MSPWKSHQSVGQRVYTRPLGLLELGFYWDSRFQGTADSCHASQLQVQDPAMFNKSRVYQAWTRLKHMYPLLAARTMSLDSTDEAIHFVIDEGRLSQPIPDEITFLSCSSAEEVTEFVMNTQNSSSRLLSDDLLARLFIVTRTDDDHLIHALTLVAHSITDGIANMTIMRTFLHLIATTEDWLALPLPRKLEERLKLASAVEDLAPSKQNVSRQRWRSATGQIIATQRQARISGGHTLPRKFTNLTSFTPAVSCCLYTSFSIDESTAILQQCRRYGVTFGNVLPVLGQVAMARLLCRRRVFGQIPSEEWEWRVKEPMLVAGPINLRPCLDKEWYMNGGGANVSLAIGFFQYLLPFMPLGAARRAVPGDRVPSFETLLSVKRFLHRSSLVKKQADKILKHPLFLEIGNATKTPRIQKIKGMVNGWQRNSDGNIPVSMSPYEQSLLGPVVGMGGSSFGNSDHLMPSEYPLSRQGQERIPRLHVLSSSVHLRCRPGELYLGASSSRKQLRLAIYYDGNVYKSEVVEEWFKEVKAAIKTYLLQIDGKL